MGSSASLSGAVPRQSLVSQVQYSTHHGISEQTTHTLHPYCYQQQQQYMREDIAAIPMAPVRPVEEAHISCDTSDDETYSRLLYAAEFLAQMSQGDLRIRKLSAAHERHIHQSTIEQLLAIRAHLQDELLRILHMLTAADPQLNSLAHFDHSHFTIVHKLRELHEREKHIDHCSSTVNTATECDQPNEGSVAGSVLDVSTGRYHMCDEDMRTKKLKEKHDKEERELSEQYATRLVSGDAGHSTGAGDHVAVTNTDQLLDDHLCSMQVLRGKQQRETCALLKTDRADQHVNHKVGIAGDNVTAGGIAQVEHRHWWQYNTAKPTPSHTTIKCQPLERRPISRRPVTQHDWQPPIQPPEPSIKRMSEVSACLTETQSPTSTMRISSATTRPSSAKSNDILEDTVTVENIHYASRHSPDCNDMMSVHTDRERRDHIQRSDKLWSERQQEVKTIADEDLVDAENQKTQLQHSLHQDLWACLRKKLTQQDFLHMVKDFRDKQYEMTTHQTHKQQSAAGCSEAGHRSTAQTHITQQTDIAFIRKLRKANSQLSDGEYSRLIREHLNSDDAARCLRESERHDLDERLKRRLSEKMDSQNYGDDISEQLCEDLKALKVRYEKSLLEARDCGAQETQLQLIFNECRLEQEKLREQWCSNRRQHKLKLEKRLQENSTQKQEALKAVDSEFFHDIQWRQYAKRLSVDEFSDRFAKYMQDTNRIMQTKKTKRKIQEEKAAASSLVQEHTQHNRYISELRKREKQITDQRLYNRLRASKEGVSRNNAE